MSDNVTLYRLRRVRMLGMSRSDDWSYYEDRDRLLSDLFDAALEACAHPDTLAGVPSHLRATWRVARFWWRMTGPATGRPAINRAVSKVEVHEYVDGTWIPLEVRFTEPGVELRRRSEKDL